jgi:hypothetical protein
MRCARKRSDLDETYPCYVCALLLSTTAEQDKQTYRPPPPVPVLTSLFFADTLPFGLRAEPRAEPTRLLQALPNASVKKAQGRG